MILTPETQEKIKELFKDKIGKLDQEKYMFDKVIGHDMPKKILTNDIDKNKISHAYAFVGPVGVGKCKLAEEFAKIKID